MSLDPFLFHPLLSQLGLYYNDVLVDPSLSLGCDFHSFFQHNKRLPSTTHVLRYSDDSTQLFAPSQGLSWLGV